MTFSSPSFSKNGITTRRNTQHSSNFPTSLIDQATPTLDYMAQRQTSLNLTPASSMSSYVRPLSISLPTSSLVPEELEDNRFYVYLRDNFDAIFTHSSLVCIPHSRYLEDHCLTRTFVETHCYNASPFFCGQYEAVNGKVIKIEQLLLSTVSGFKEQRTVHIISEESVYIDDKKIRVYMIQIPLEGEAMLYQKRRNTINIPTCRNSKSDLNFLNFFAENAESLVELQSAVQEFVVTYVYIRGFSNYTVEKIQHIYTKAYMTILQRNKLIRDTCRIQAEHEHFLELVENVVMGLLHEKIWVQSLRSILQSKDNYINSICEWYSKDNITLQKYGVSYPISEMPLSCFDRAIACLRRTDATSDTPIYTTYNMKNPTSTNISASNDLAFTPLEKIACIKTTMDLISAAVDDYAKETSNRSSYNGSYVTTDEMIPLLAYVIVHSRISRMASLVFYVEHFRLSHMERSEHGFALATLKTAVSFLKKDPLFLLKITSTDYTLPTSTISSASLSLQSQNLRSKSTPSVSPLTSPTLSISQHAPVYNHYSTTDSFQVSSHKPTHASKSSKPSSTLPSSSSLSSLNIRHSNLQRPTGGLLHRKSQSAGPPCISNDQKQQQQLQQKQQQRQSSPSSSSSSSSSSDSCKEDDYMGMINTPTHHRHSYTPKNCSEIYVQSFNEIQQNGDHSYDWILYDNDISKLSSDLIATIDTSQHDQQQRQHQQQRPSYCQNIELIHNNQHQQFTQPNRYRAHSVKPITPPKFVLGGTRPMFSATTPIISNSTTSQAGDIPPTSSVANTIKQQQQQQRHYYHHQHYQCSTTSTEHQEVTTTAAAAQLESTSNCAMGYHGSATRPGSPKSTGILSSNTPCHFTLPDLPNLLYREPPLNDLDNANNRRNQVLSRSTVNKEPIQHPHSPAKSTAPQLQHLTSNSPQQPPQIIHVIDRLLSFDSGGLGRRPASFCLDTRSSSSFMYGRTRGLNNSQEGLGEFLLGLQKQDGDVVGEGDGHVSK